MSQHKINNIEDHNYDYNRIQSLKLNNFRSYENLECSFEGCPVVLLGPNGSGKTNILESLSLLSPGRGLRRAPFEHFRNIKGPPEWGINVNILSDNVTYKISTGIPAGRIKGREVKINNKKVVASKSLPEIISISWLTPSMDQIFIESPSSRRKFLDMLCSSFINNHSSLLRSYEKLMRERNNLLQEDKSNTNWLDALETQMASNGIDIALNRIKLAKGLNSKLDNDKYPVWPRAFLKIDGITEDKLFYGDIEDTKIFYLKNLFENRTKDFFSGRTSFGIHKSDLLVSHRGKGIFANQCSTGEQKSLLIGLILNHLSLIAENSNRYPILLLDEIVAHLDQLRRTALFDQIIETNAQIFMTGTDTDMFSAINEFSEIFSVGMGRLKKIN